MFTQEISTAGINVVLMRLRWQRTPPQENRSDAEEPQQEDGRAYLSFRLRCSRPFFDFPGEGAVATRGTQAISRPVAPYSELAKKYGLKGAVRWKWLSRRMDTSRRRKVIGGHPMLVASVKDTLKSWKYAPESAESTAVLHFDFRP